MTAGTAPAQAAASAANGRGVAALREGRASDAVAAFREAVAADPTAGALLRNLASAYRLADQPAEELVALDAALALDRQDLVAWLRKAEVHQRFDQRGDALVAWTTALALAEPLRPWSGPLAEVLQAGEAWQKSAIASMRQGIGAQLETEFSDLGQRERRRTRAFVEHALGGRRLFSNECAGLCYPFLPADEFFDDEHFPWFADFARATAAIRTELLDLLKDPGEALRPYVRMEQGTPDSKWSDLDGKLDWSALFLWEYGEPNNAVLERCPATAAALAAIPRSHIPGRSPSAFFSILRPGARIPPHTGVTNSRAIVHLPLIVPPGCGFRVGGETREWVEGVPFGFDDTIEHEAWNNSDEPRAVLICDVWNPHLTPAEQAFIVRYYETGDASGFAPSKR
jgi:aspartyl/asparaginyl beta-hydroxylase (cupin superfamily)